MATVRLWTDEDVAKSPRVKAVFDDIRAMRKIDRYALDGFTGHALR
jgi:hypothetical protein